MKIFNFISSTFGIKVDIEPHNFPQEGIITAAPGYHYCLVRFENGEFITSDKQPVHVVAIDSAGHVRRTIREGDDNVKAVKFNFMVKFR